MCLSQARDTYMAGSPLVTDEFFDKIEARGHCPPRQPCACQLTYVGWAPLPQSRRGVNTVSMSSQK